MYASGERVRVHLDGVPDLATVRAAVPSGDTSGWTLFLLDDDGGIHEVELTADDTHTVTKIQTDGAADSARVLAGMWTRWMSAAATNAESSAIASTQLRPYAHQTTAVYGAMLPQPLLRFLLADEPGTGKTIMAGLYLREMQRLGLVQRAIIVCPRTSPRNGSPISVASSEAACATSPQTPFVRKPSAATTSGSCHWSSPRSTRPSKKPSGPTAPAGTS